MRHLPSLTLLVVLLLGAAGCGSGKDNASGGTGSGGSPTADGGAGGSGGASSTSTTSTGGATTTTTTTTTTTGTGGTGGTGGSAVDAGSDAADAGDPCSPNPCTQPNQTQCQVQGGVAVCSCDPGSHLAGSTCVPDSTCTATTCGGHGTCSPADGGTVSCACDTGWAPPFCAACDTGYHADGMGGCTTNPCLPDPCTAANKTTCTPSGSTAACSCDTGYHDDGMGGCTTDPCTPNPCTAQNKACTVVGGQATCVTPSCDDGNPCTTDTVVQGACVHTPVTNGTACGTSPCLTGETCQAGVCSGGSPASCDDGDPCTADTCVSSTGCTHTPALAGTPCNDGIACTTGDTCNAQGACAGTVTAACSATTCTTTTSLGATIDIPVAQMTATITLAGQPLPATNEYGSSATLYLVAKDTGEWHILADFLYNGSGNPASLYGPTVTPRVVPGVYDVYYCHNCETATNTTNIAGETDAADALPNGLRVLQSNVVVGTGHTHLSIDIPVAQTTATITLAGQPLPATNEYGSSATLYLVAKDTGEWHILADFLYNGSGNPASLYGPVVTPRVVPGTYDVYYCHNCETLGTSAPVAGQTDVADALPNGLRVLQSNVVVSSGANHLDIDIPVAQTTATITLGGQPLPAANEYGSSATLYLVAKDTGEWHILADFLYNGSGNPASLYGPVVTPRVVPGTYDVYYCHNCETGTNTTNIAGETDAADALPNGLRILQSNVVVSSGANHLDVDIPVAQTTATITLAGQPLPATNEYGSSATLYLVAKDTGEWHVLADFLYNGSGNPASLYGPTVTPRVVPGTYDIYYCHNCETLGTSAPVAGQTDVADALPNGLRILQSDVVVSSGANHLDIDIPVAQTTATITLGGQPLPAANEYGSSADLYLVAKDTGEWHILADFLYNGSGNPASLYGPVVTPRVVPGTYDVYYCHNCETATNTTDVAGETDAADALPNGLRILQSNVVVSPGANHLGIDIPVTSVAETITLGGQALPAANEYGSSADLYLVARDTGEWHILADFLYNGSGNPASLYGPVVTPRVVPGTYDVYYCHNCETQGAGAPVAGETDPADALPNGLRVLQSCVTVP